MTSVSCPHCQALIEFRLKSRPKPASPTSASVNDGPTSAAATTTAKEIPAPSSDANPPQSTEHYSKEQHSPELKTADSTSSKPKEPQLEPAASDPSQPSIAHKPLESLLPPTFDLGEQASGVGPRGRQSQVILPTSDGGFQHIDTNTVTIKHEGKSVTLIASTPQERARRRFIENVIAIVLAVGIFALALWILR